VTTHLLVTSEGFVEDIVLPHGSLLASGWRVTHWARPGETPSSVETRLSAPEALRLYDVAYGKGMRPVRWEHPHRGVAEFRDERWQNPHAGFDTAREVAALLEKTNPPVRSWQIGTFAIGEAGDVKEESVAVCVNFRIDKIFATDGKDSSEPATEIISATVDQREVLAFTGLTSWFSRGREVVPGVVVPIAAAATFRVRFHRAATWSVEMFGEATA